MQVKNTCMGGKDIRQEDREYLSALFLCLFNRKFWGKFVIQWLMNKLKYVRQFRQ